MPSDPPATALFDRRAWRLHRDRAARLTRGQGGGADFLHAEIADRLIDRLDLVSREFPIVLDLGARDGALTRTVAMRPGTVQVVAAEPSATFLTTTPPPRVAADPEFLPFRPASFDLIASVLVLHWTADLPGALVQLRQDAAVFEQDGGVLPTPLRLGADPRFTGRGVTIAFLESLSRS